MHIIKSLSSALAVAVLVVSLPSGSSASTLVNADLGRYDGKTIFEGLIFNQGPVAGRFPETQDAMKAEQAAMHVKLSKSESAKAVAQLEGDFEKVDPGFFKRYGTDMTSGDPGVVRSAIERSKIDVERIGKLEHYKLQKRDVAGCGACGGINAKAIVNVGYAASVAIGIAALVVYIAALVYIAGVFVVVISPLITVRMADNGFRYDKAIALITERLAGRGA